ncbi:FAD-dependent oxidoreductase [Caballeronia sp. LZ008]|uniref:FAD-dependent oxidoreductase n=1 Tax=unclassified Caballeronia TaxID=2646786 RepID=UPI0020294905|nr:MULTISPECIES: FAD-dependent oxidoreductase [unclassified Caballeronia]MDR5793742.1 FAD-dependent oxidoreductase [Caballeronia sp. LZ008]
MSEVRRAVEEQALIIGGGFYGAALACYLREQRGFSRVLVLEQEEQLMTRASFTNQARVHNGYHYPRSVTTGIRSRVNFPRFVEQFGPAVRSDFVKLYAIASNSNVAPGQFERFCRSIGAQLELASPAHAALFEKRLIRSVYAVQEYAFDSLVLRELMAQRMKELNVDVRFNSRVRSLSNRADALGAIVENVRTGEHWPIDAQWVFNCTYSRINRLSGDFPKASTGLKHQVTEMALMKPPRALEDIGVTVMDGPFFSFMPFPSKGLHSLSHVRYTPHVEWIEDDAFDTEEMLERYSRVSRVDRMVRDSARYLPILEDAQYADSLFEIKSVLLNNERDDGRPILLERHAQMPRCFSILGGKIDNVFDVLERLDAVSLPVR